MHKESRTDRWLRTLFVQLLVLLLLLIIFNGTAKTSDVSNWIIAFANIAMAAAAIGAWRAARKFLSEFFAQEGYRLAIALVNENVIYLGDKNRYQRCAEEAVATCQRLSGAEHTRIGTEQLAAAVEAFKHLHHKHKAWLDNIHSLVFQMETYGLHPATDKQAALTEMTTALASMVSQGDSLLEHLMSNTQQYKKRVDSNQNLYRPFSMQSRGEINGAISTIGTAWADMVAHRKALLADGKHARTLFEVRES
ncbi:hypothetical protein V7423_004306 [Escherichia coli]|nr:hypothetical protein [Escherichia coli]